MDAAPALFAEHGIGSTSIEQIAEAAGFSRGAFYSNFDSRDELVFALLERHQETTIDEAKDLLASAESAQDFIAAMVDREENLDHVRARLSIEYVLYATRSIEGRERLKAVNAGVLQAMADLVEAQFELMGETLPIPVQDAAKMLLALDEGYALLRLIDPDAYPAGIWGETLAYLSEATSALILQQTSNG